MESAINHGTRRGPATRKRLHDDERAGPPLELLSNRLLRDPTSPLSGPLRVPFKASRGHSAIEVADYRLGFIGSILGFDVAQGVSYGHPVWARAS